MNILFAEHLTILKKLISANVDFILVGGYAVVFHGYNRLTGDMDLWIRPDNVNKMLLIDALDQLGFDAEGLLVIQAWDFTKPQVFHVGKVPERTDFMTHIAGVSYDDAKTIAIVTILDGLTINVIHISTLIQNKKASGRTKDLADAEYLEKIIQLRKRKY